MSDGHEDVFLLSGAYALDALTSKERRAVEEAMRQSQEMRDEVTGLLDTAVALGLSVPPVAPPDALRSRLLDAIEDLPQQAPEEEPESEPAAAVGSTRSGSHVAPRRRRRTRTVGTVLAALGVAALLFGGGVVVQGAVQGTQSEFSRVEAAPDVQRASAQLAGGGTADIAWSPREQRTAVVLNGAKVPEGRVLQLWSIRGSSITSRGLYRPQGGDDYVVLDRLPAAGESFAVSIEPPGGSLTPTTVIAQVPLRS